MAKKKQPHILTATLAGQRVTLATLSVRKSRAERAARKIAPLYRPASVTLARAGQPDADSRPAVTLP